MILNTAHKNEQTLQLLGCPCKRGLGDVMLNSHGEKKQGNTLGCLYHYETGLIRQPELH